MSLNIHVIGGKKVKKKKPEKDKDDPEKEKEPKKKPKSVPKKKKGEELTLLRVLFLWLFACCTVHFVCLFLNIPRFRHGRRRQ